MRTETYDRKLGLRERVEVTRVAGDPIYQRWVAPDFTAPVEVRPATADETVSLMLEEQEIKDNTYWTNFRTEVARADPNVKSALTLLEKVIASIRNRQ